MLFFIFLLYLFHRLSLFPLPFGRGKKLPPEEKNSPSLFLKKTLKYSGKKKLSLLFP